MNSLKKNEVILKGVSIILIVVLAISLTPFVQKEFAFADDTPTAAEVDVFETLGFQNVNETIQSLEKDEDQLDLPYGETGMMTKVNEVMFQWSEPGASPRRDFRTIWGMGGELYSFPTKSAGYSQKGWDESFSSCDWKFSCEGDFDGDGRQNDIAYFTFFHYSSDKYYRYSVSYEIDGSKQESRVTTIGGSEATSSLLVSEDTLLTLWDKAHIVSGDVNGDGYDDIIILVGKQIITFSHGGDFQWSKSDRYFNRGSDYLKYHKDYDKNYTSPMLDKSSSTASIDIGDINNDGYDDIVYVASAIRENPAGTVYLAEALFGGKDAPTKFTSRPIPTPGPGKGHDDSETPGRLGLTLTNYDGDRYLDILLAWVDVVDLNFNKNDNDGFIAKTYNVDLITYNYDKNKPESISTLSKKTNILADAATESSGHAGAKNKDFEGINNTAALRIAKGNVASNKSKGITRAVIINGAVHVIANDGISLNKVPYYNLTDPSAKADKRGANMDTAIMQTRVGSTNGYNDGFLVQWIKNERGSWATTEGNRYTLNTDDRQCVVYWNGQELELTKQVSKEVPLLACLPDLDNDSIRLEFESHDVVFADPQVIAVLAAPPYFRDLAGAYSVATAYPSGSETSYSISAGSGSGDLSSVSHDAGAYLKAEAQFGAVAQGTVEGQTSYSHTWTDKTEYAYSEVKTSTAYAYPESGDAVVLYAIPLDVYTYKASYPTNGGLGDSFTTEPALVCIPAGAAQFSSMSLDNYTAKRDLLSSIEFDEGCGFDTALPDLANVFNHTVGDPSSYSQSPPSDIKNNSLIRYDDTMSATNATGMEQRISITEQTTTTKTTAHNFNISGGAGFAWDVPAVSSGKIVAGASYGYVNEQGTIETEISGNEYAFKMNSVPNPFGSEGYSYSAELMTYIKQVKEGEKIWEFPVVDVLVTQVPETFLRLPLNYGALPDKATSDSVTLYWKKSPDDRNPSDSAASMYRIYDVVGGVIDKPLSARATWNDEEQRYELRINSLSPSTSYNYAISVVKDGNESAKSKVFTANTKSEELVQFEYNPTDIELNGISAQNSLTATLNDEILDSLRYTAVSFTWQRVEEGGVIPVTEESGAYTISSTRQSSTLRFDNPSLADHGIYQVVATITETTSKYDLVSEPAHALWIPQTPTSPIVESFSSSAVQLKTIANGEYRINNGEWQLSPLFEGLTSGTEYEFQQRSFTELHGQRQATSMPSGPTVVRTSYENAAIASATLSLSAEQDAITVGDQLHVNEPGEIRATLTELTLDPENAALAEVLISSDIEYKWLSREEDSGYPDPDSIEWISGSEGGNTLMIGETSRTTYYKVLARLSGINEILESYEVRANIIGVEFLSILVNQQSENAWELSGADNSLLLGLDYYPDNTSYREVTWSVVSGEDYVAVDSTGLLTARANTEGTPAIVRVSSLHDPHVYDEIAITVSDLFPFVQKITLSGGNTISDPEGGTLQLSASILPENAEDKTIVWSLEDGGTDEETLCATIDQTGLITAAQPGTVIARASAADGSGVSATRIIYITEDIVEAKAQIEDTVIEGVTGADMLEQHASLLLDNEVIANGGLTSVDVSDWFSNLPEGITVTAEGSEYTDQINLSFTGKPSVALTEVIALTIPGVVLEGGEDLSLTRNEKAFFKIEAAADRTVDLFTIQGVTVPVYLGIPAQTILETTQYTGAVTWSPSITEPSATFEAGTQYTATITLTAKDGFTFDGIKEDSFIVPGADTVTNDADSGIITAIFPAIASQAIVVGEQNGTLIQGNAGSVTYGVSTLNIANGVYPVTVNNAPLGIEAEAVTIFNGMGELRLSITETTPGGSHAITVSIADVESYPFTLTVSEPTTSPTVRIGAQNETLVSGIGGSATFGVETSQMADGVYTAAGQDPNLVITGAPEGVSVFDLILDGGQGSLEFVVSDIVQPGQYDMVLALGGVESTPFTLIVGSSAPLERIELNILSSLLKLTYHEGEKLDLTGLLVNLVYEDGTRITEIPYPDFATRGIAVTYEDGGKAAHGDTLVVSGHNGKSVILSIDGQNLNIGSLTVAIPTNGITLNQATGGTASLSSLDAAAGTQITVSITNLEEYYNFDSWSVAPPVTWVSSDSKSMTATFIMPNEPVTIEPIYTYLGPGPGAILVDEIIVTGPQTIMTKGGTTQLSVSISPHNATDKEVTWTSSDDSLASVDANGLVTAKADGAVTITATARDGSQIFGSIEITISGQAPGIPSYYFKDGLSSHTQGSGTPIVVIIDKDVNTHLQTRLNNTVLGAGQHSISGGSTIVTLEPAYLSSLPVGTHTLRIDFNDGTFVEDSITVLANSSDTKQDGNATPTDLGTSKTSSGSGYSAKTGDSLITTIIFLGIVALASISTLTLAQLRRRKEK